MLISVSVDDDDALDYNSNGDHFIDLIDAENTRYAREQQRLQALVAQQRELHMKQLDKIWQSFGICRQHPLRMTPTRGKKEQIRRKVRQWYQSALNSH